MVKQSILSLFVGLNIKPSLTNNIIWLLFSSFFSYICLFFYFQHLALNFNLYWIISFLIPCELLTSLRGPEVLHSTLCSWEKPRDATVLVPFDIPFFSIAPLFSSLFFLLPKKQSSSFLKVPESSSFQKNSSHPKKWKTALIRYV